MKLTRKQPTRAVKAPQFCIETLLARGWFVQLAPGRLEIEAPALKDNPQLARLVRYTLSQVAGVERVSAGPRRCRVLVEFAPRCVSHQSLVDRMYRLGCFGTARAPARRAAPVVAPTFMEVATKVVTGLVLDTLIAAVI
ncbi:MAG: hypothetical protein ACYCW6_30650 [Candidatus Xenobia bacterium]